MKIPKHHITPHDWPQTEEAIHDIDIEISEIKSQITSNISVLSLAFDSQLSAVSGEFDSRILVLESEVSALQAHEPTYVEPYHALVHSI